MFLCMKQDISNRGMVSVTVCLADDSYQFPAQCELLQIDEVKLLGSSAVQAANIEQTADCCIDKVSLSFSVIGGCTSCSMCINDFQVEVVALLSNATPCTPQCLCVDIVTHCHPQFQQYSVNCQKLGTASRCQGSSRK